MRWPLARRFPRQRSIPRPGTSVLKKQNIPLLTDMRSSQATIACPVDAEHLTGAPSPQRKTGGLCRNSIVGPEHALRWQGLRPDRGHSSCLNRPNRLVMRESFAVNHWREGTRVNASCRWDSHGLIKGPCANFMISDTRRNQSFGRRC